MIRSIGIVLERIMGRGAGCVTTHFFLEAGVWTMRVIGLIFALFAAQVSAAVLETEITPKMREMGCTARLSGAIETGDLDRFRPFLETPRSGNMGSDTYVEDLIFRNFAPATDFAPDGFFTHRICLDSPGGSLVEAMRIVEYIRQQSASQIGGPSGIQTAIAQGDRCESACAYVFFAGRFVRFSGSKNYEGRSNHLLHPLGRLGLHAPFISFSEQNYAVDDVEAIWRVGMMATSLISRQIAQGNIFMSNDLFSEMVTFLPTEMLVVETVGQAVRWDINVEPNLLSNGSYGFSEEVFVDSLCRNAVSLVPDYFDMQVSGSSGGISRNADGVVHSNRVFTEKFSERSYRCAIPSGTWKQFQEDLQWRFNGEPRQRQVYTCFNSTVVFETVEDCYQCDIEIVSPCIAVFPPDLSLSEV
jgi:hypothetical protein